MLPSGPILEVLDHRIPANPMQKAERNKDEGQPAYQICSPGDKHGHSQASMASNHTSRNIQQRQQNHQAATTETENGLTDTSKGPDQPMST